MCWSDEDDSNFSSVTALFERLAADKEMEPHLKLSLASHALALA
jgi:hypothetical protein